LRIGAEPHRFETDILMKPALLNFLACFECGSPFELESLLERPVGLSPEECAVMTSSYRDRAQYEREIISGRLHCAKCGLVFPIVRGIPRIYKEAPKTFGLDESRALKENKDEGHVQTTFSREWNEFDYDDNTIWLWSVDSRIDTFCEEVGVESPAELTGKVMLDAGCGSGILSMNLSERFQIEIIAMDMSTILDRAFERNTSNLLHFVQGSVLSPPIKPNVGDLTYSHGVLHHTSSTVNAFERIAPLTKDGGMLYVWLYGKKKGWNRFRFLFIRSIRFFVSRLPKQPQTAAVWIMGAIHGAVRVLKRLVGYDMIEHKTLNQYLVGIRDKYTPKYAREHTEPEIRGWFEAAGFKNVVRRTSWPKTPFWEGSTDIAMRGEKA
jgi:ubiquinone/menaquinone biosynthesis C-methylase UbiE/uncharacterized protein YbaR (Trm112 family)